MHAGFHFVANLKPYTVHRGAGNARFNAYLLSTDYAGAFQDLAKEILERGSALCADNGNVDVFRDLVAANTSVGEALDEARKIAELRIGRHARPGDLPNELRDRYRSLASSVRTASASGIDPARIAEVVRKQNAMTPTYLIGMEDFTLGTLTGLGVAPEFVEEGAVFYEGLAMRAVELAVDTQAGRYGPCAATVFAGMHAVDYDSARIAGRAAGAAGVAGVALGLVGALQDNGYTDFRIEDGRVAELDGAMPRPYLRVAELVAGLHEGFVETAGRRPCFHGLGVGTPILLPLLAALGDGTTYTAIDSTAPIVDGWSGPTISVYVDDPAPLKYKAHRIVQAWLADGVPWHCRCPYCEAFDHAYPPRIDEARGWWLAQGKPKLTEASVRSASPISGWLPFLGSAAHPGLRLTGAMARVGHNHWILQRIEAAARRHSTNGDTLLAWVDGIVRAYVASPADPAWKPAVESAWAILRRAALATRAAAPSKLVSV